MRGLDVRALVHGKFNYRRIKMTYEEIQDELHELVHGDNVPLVSWETMAELLNGTLSND